MRKKIYSLFLLLSSAVLAAPLLYSSAAQALTFNPGNIISDSVFTNSQSMTANQIQDFIRAKNVNCTDGEAPCLRNFTQNGKSAGTIIAEASSTYGINPQVLLVLLQKETGLVTRNKPTVWLYTIATGYGCPDTAVCDSQYYGFTNQVHRAARMFRFIMNNDPNWYTPYVVGNNYIQYNPSTSCGGTNVNIVNRATQALYNYTPYQPNAAALAAGYGEGNSCSAYGNRNFWLFFNDWFGSTQSSILLQSPRSPAVYLQSGNTRYGIPTWDIINAYGLNGTPVTPVTDNYMDSLTDGGVLSTVFTRKGENPVYVADNGKRYGFATYQQCIDWGFSRCLDTSYSKALEPAIFDRLESAGALTALMSRSGTTYLMDNGSRRAFVTEKAIQENGYASVRRTPIVNNSNSSQPQSYPLLQNNILIQFANNPAIYLYNASTFHTLTWEAYRGIANTATPFILDKSSRYVTSPPSSTSTIGSYVKFSDGKAYAFSNGNKIDITAVKSDWPEQQTLDSIRAVVDHKSVNAVATSASTYQTPNGALLKIENRKWRMFYNLDDYFALGNTIPISISQQVVQDMPVGQPIFAPGNGSLYQVSTPGLSNGIYTTSADGTICQVYSMPQIGLYKLSTANVYRITSLEPGVKSSLLSTTVYDEAGNLHIVYGGVHTTIPSDTLRAVWGVNKRLNICSLSTKILNRNSVNKPSPRFVRNEHTGIIYMGEGGTKRPIYSWNAFLRLGGNSDNTHDVSMEFLVSAPDGTPIFN